MACGVLSQRASSAWLCPCVFEGARGGERAEKEGGRDRASHAVRVELYELIGDRTFVSCSLAVGSRSTAFLGSAFGAGWEWWWWWW